MAEALHEVFIKVDVATEHSADPELAKRLEEACPVDIFKATDGGVTVVTENEDECVLCGLCLDASPPGAVTVTKLYDGTTLER
ncbi:MAG: ferredoxin family protein [Actinomycetota bacterium]|nr:ferredoxin family protein [Actinomycetota bacterium]